MSELDEIVAEIDRLAAHAERLDPKDSRVEATIHLHWIRKRGVVFFEGLTVVEALVGVADDMLTADATPNTAAQALRLAGMFAKCLQDVEAR